MRVDWRARKIKAEAIVNQQPSERVKNSKPVMLMSPFAVILSPDLSGRRIPAVALFQSFTNNCRDASRSLP
jgi:hypothetical protein